MKTIGHPSVRHFFERTLARGRLASTYLFVGPEGVGKRTFASELAAGLLCLRNDASEGSFAACGDCDSCQMLAGGSHPDFLPIARPAGKATLPIELFVGRAEHRNREGLCHDIAMKPFLGDRRIAVIDDVDHLSIESANCLLKTLEEPPPRSLMILVGTSLSKQLPTIRSRCQVVRFDRLTDDEVATVLTERDLLEEGQSATKLAAAADGSVSRALSGSDESLAAFRKELLAIVSRPAFDPIRLSTSVIEHSQAGASDPATRRRRLQTLLGYVIEYDRQQLRQAANDGAPREPTLARLDHTMAATEAIDRNANQATAIQTWAIALAKA